MLSASLRLFMLFPLHHPIAKAHTQIYGYDVPFSATYKGTNQNKW